MKGRLRFGSYVLGPHMLRPDPHAEEAGGDTAQPGPAAHQTQDERRLGRLAGAQVGGEDAVLDDDLEALNDSGGKQAAALDLVEVAQPRDALLEHRGEDVRGCDSVDRKSTRLNSSHR